MARGIHATGNAYHPDSLTPVTITGIKGVLDT